MITVPVPENGRSYRIIITTVHVRVSAAGEIESSFYLKYYLNGIQFPIEFITFALARLRFCPPAMHSMGTVFEASTFCNPSKRARGRPDLPSTKKKRGAF